MSTTRNGEARSPSVRPVRSLDDILGCENAKTAVVRALKAVGKPPKLFLAGPSGSAKSTLVAKAVEYVACSQPVDLRACGLCPGCTAFRQTGGKQVIGLDAERSYWECDHPIDYLIINCRNATVAEIEKGLDVIRSRTHALRIIHLEEAASLYQDRRDERLTGFMDDSDFDSCHWLATAVTDVGLDEQFRRRWSVKITTSPPTVEDLADDLALCCRRNAIHLDHPRTWTLLARTSHCLVSQAVSLLEQVVLSDSRLLTREFVLTYPFPRENPWTRDFFQT